MSEGIIRKISREQKSGKPMIYQVGWTYGNSSEFSIKYIVEKDNYFRIYAEKNNLSTMFWKKVPIQGWTVSFDIE